MMTVTATAPAQSLAELDLSLIDLTDPLLYAAGEPHPIWAAMRNREPVRRQVLPDGRAFWSVTRHRDVHDVLRDYGRFSSRQGQLLSVLGTPTPAADKMLDSSDPPIHTAMRLPLTKVLSHSALKTRSPHIRRVVRRMLAAMLDEPSWDIAKAAGAFPMAFTGELMGLPESDWPMLSRLAVTAVAPDDPEYHRSARHGAAAAANYQLFSYLTGQVRDKAARQDDDLIGFLTRVDAGGRRLRPDEIVYNCYSLLLGGNLTTPHVATGTVLALADNPAELRRLAADPALITTGVEEGLRWVSPARHFMRHVVADTEVAGVRLSAGDAIVAWIGAANRDETVFADPYRFDVGRSPNRHVAFGFGAHYCLGAPLARIALRVFLEEFVSTVAEVELAGPVQHLHSNFLAAFKSAPVTARLRASAIPVLQEAMAADGPLRLLGAGSRAGLPGAARAGRPRNHEPDGTRPGPADPGRTGRHPRRGRGRGRGRGRARAHAARAAGAAGAAGRRLCRGRLTGCRLATGRAVVVAARQADRRHGNGTGQRDDWLAVHGLGSPMRYAHTVTDECLTCVNYEEKPAVV
jgi:cytochrome P450